MLPRSAKSQSLLTPVVKKLICDTTSFESICQLNHTLHTIGEQTDYLMCGGRGGVEGDMSEKDYQDLRDALTAIQVLGHMPPFSCSQLNLPNYFC